MTADPAAIPLDDPTLPDRAQDLDLRGLRCPLPVLRTRKALLRLAPGALLRVCCTDPLAGLDIPHLLNATGDTLLEMQRSGPAQVFLIRKA